MEDEIYFLTAQIIQKVFAKKDSVRNQVFSSSTGRKKLLMKLCCDVIKYRSVLERIVSETPELAQDSAFPTEAYLTVVLFEFLFGKQSLKVERKVRNALEKRRAQLLKLKKELTEEGLLDENGEIQKKEKSSTASTSWTDLPIPRYARINTLLIKKNRMLWKLKREGWKLQEYDAETTSRRKFREIISSLPSDEFVLDRDIPGLLVFPRGATLHTNSFTRDRELLLQDKASCLPIQCLNPEPGSVVLDSCAAPGMKTCHIASLLNNEGTIYAYDRDGKRYRTLSELLEISGATCAVPTHQDFLKTNLVRDLSEVQYALVDPPCSGSGIVSRQDEITDTEETKPKSRLRSLANIQAMLLKHALRMPNVQRVVYSTCSIYEEENEMVINEILSCDEFDSTYQIVTAFPEWKHRGKKGYEFGRCCLRSSPDKDLTNGFFVAVLERKST